MPSVKEASSHHNVNPSEIENFNSLAHEWWDPEGKCRPLHDINPLRFQFISDRCKLSQKHVIDIGCGAGILTERMAAQGAKVTGIDASQELIEVAKLHALKNKYPIDYMHTTAEELVTSHAHSFDVVTCLELLEHVPYPLSIIQSAVRLVKPNGDLFFSTLNRTLKSYLLAIFGAEYMLNLLPKGTHTYDQFIKPSELADWLRISNLELVDMAGFKYNPLSHDATLTEDVSINYIIHARPIA